MVRGFSTWMGVAAFALLAGCSGTASEIEVAAASADLSAEDGTPVRNECTGTFGNGLSGTSGRLDGTIVAIVEPGGPRSCHGDRTHLHLQVLANGSVYDVAVNMDGLVAEKDTPLPGEGWAEGWHRGSSLHYDTDLGLHSADFQGGNLVEVTRLMDDALASANHVSIFGTLYGHGGLHLIHRSRSASGIDGAVVVDPLAQSAKVYAFRFDNQSF